MISAQNELDDLIPWRTAVPLLSFSRDQSRLDTDLLAEIKAVNRLLERRFPSCTVQLLLEAEVTEEPAGVTVELDGPREEIGDNATWYCSALRERGVLCDRVTESSDNYAVA